MDLDLGKLKRVAAIKSSLGTWLMEKNSNRKIQFGNIRLSKLKERKVQWRIEGEKKGYEFADEKI